MEFVLEKDTLIIMLKDLIKTIKDKDSKVESSFNMHNIINLYIENKDKKISAIISTNDIINLSLNKELG